MKMEKQNFHSCPMFDMSCPYCLASGVCTIGVWTIGDPLSECDDYFSCVGNYEKEEEENEI